MRSTRCTMLLACTVIAGVTGCTTGTTPTSAPATPAVSTPAETPSVGNPSAAPTPTGTPAPADTPIAACAPGQVDITATGLGAAMSHHGITLTFSIANPAEACTLRGYPGLDLTTSTGEVVHAERTTSGYMSPQPTGDPEPTVVVKSGHPATAIAESVACGVYGKPDPKVVKTQVTPPNSTDTRMVDQALDTCNLKIHPVTA
ncbi:DUF4232 domain-containing protein [Nocardia sp. NPDC004582]